MKKVLPMLLALLMVITLPLSMTATAARTTKSPSKTDVELIDYKNDSDDCHAELVLRGFSDVDQLVEFIKQLFTDVYNDIVTGGNKTGINDVISNLASSNNEDVSKYSISELFDISWYNCTDHEENHSFFTIKIGADSLKGFRGIFHYTGTEWELLDSELGKDGETLTFRSKEMTPFIIVVNTEDPSAGDTSNIALWLMLLSAAAFLLVLFAMKKRKAKV